MEIVELENLIAELGPVRFAVDEQGVSHALDEEVVNENSRRFNTERSNSNAPQRDTLTMMMGIPAVENNPAPNGSECVIYLSRNIRCVTQKAREEMDSTFFYGELRGKCEPLLLNFNLSHDVRAEYYDLRIEDATRPFESNLSLARFQQASLLLQFMKYEEDGSSTIIHEEPAFQISLDLPHSRWQDQEWEDFVFWRNSDFSITCANVLPVHKMPIVQKQGEEQVIMMRIYMKLMQGEVDTLHGIQKYFHPDKALYDLRDIMEKSLAGAIESDVIIVSGADFVGYRAHRSILAANSEVFKAMCTHKMKDSKDKDKIMTPSFVTDEVLAAFLKFLYARNRKDLLNKPSLTMGVLRLADFYGVELLVDVCEESILAMPIDLFSIDSCLYIFLHAFVFEKAAIETKMVHVLMHLNVKLSTSSAYMNFLRTAPEAAAKMSDMVMQFKGTSTSQE